MRKFSSFFAVTVAVLMLASCRTGLDTPDGGKTSAYHITAVEIVTKPPFPADAYPAFEVLQPVLREKIEKYLAYHSDVKSPDAVLSIQVTQLDMRVSGGQALMIGDRQEIHSDVMLLDPLTRRVLGTKTIVTKGHNHTGILGMITSGLLPDDITRKNLATDHAALIVDEIYPNI